jgi:hypothetical protein
MTKNVAILSITHHRQNPLGSILFLSLGECRMALLTELWEPSFYAKVSIHQLL